MTPYLPIWTSAKPRPAPLPASSLAHRAAWARMNQAHTHLMRHSLLTLHHIPTTMTSSLSQPMHHWQPAPTRPRLIFHPPQSAPRTWPVTTIAQAVNARLSRHTRRSYRRSTPNHASWWAPKLPPQPSTMQRSTVAKASSLMASTTGRAGHQPRSNLVCTSVAGALCSRPTRLTMHRSQQPSPWQNQSQWRILSMMRHQAQRRAHQNGRPAAHALCQNQARGAILT